MKVLNHEGHEGARTESSKCSAFVNLFVSFVVIGLNHAD